MTPDAARTLLASDYAGNVDKAKPQAPGQALAPAAAAPQRQVRHLAA
jgi:hypothetical protein